MNYPSTIKSSLIILVGSLVLIYLPLLSSAKAFDAAATYPVADSAAVNGDILSELPSKGLVRSTIPYDDHIFGVFDDNPLVVYRKLSPSQTDHPVVREGNEVVNVTDINGQIKPGDYITTSLVPGKGMKATSPGYVLGIAISNVTTGDQITFQNKKLTVGQVYVALRVQYLEASLTSSSGFGLLNALNNSFLTNLQDPAKFTFVFRYTLAGILTVIAFLIGFFAFTRSIAKGIEAIGRNPLAKGTIQASILIQFVLTIFTCLGAIVVAFLIIKF